MLVFAFITDPAVVQRILRHLGLPTEPAPLAPPACLCDEPATFADHAIDPPFFDDDAHALINNSARAPP